MNLQKKFNYISKVCLKESLLNVTNQIEEFYESLVNDEKKCFLKWVEFDLIPKRMVITARQNQIMEIKQNSEQILDIISVIEESNQKTEFLQAWVNEKKSTTENSNFALDLSNTTAKEKIIYLQKLGVLDFLRAKTPFNTSVLSLASVLSGITGENEGTLQSYLNPIYSSGVAQKNNPLNNKETVSNVVSQLLNIGFNPDETI